MATATKSAKKSTKKAAGKKAVGKKSNPCWDGYEPTPGKKPGTKGSCKPEK